MIVFVPKESRSGETRVAASPDTVKKMVALGFNVHVEKGAGDSSRISDADYKSAGATAATAKSAGSADVVLKVLRPTPAEAKKYKKGALVLASMDPFGNEAEVKAMATAGLERSASDRRSSSGRR